MVGTNLAEVGCRWLCKEQDRRSQGTRPLEPRGIRLFLHTLPTASGPRNCVGGDGLFGLRLFYSKRLALWADLISLEPPERVGCCRVTGGAVISDQS